MKKYHYSDANLPPDKEWARNLAKSTWRYAKEIVKRQRDEWRENVWNHRDDGELDFSICPYKITEETITIPDSFFLTSLNSLVEAKFVTVTESESGDAK